MAVLDRWVTKRIFQIVASVVSYMVFDIAMSQIVLYRLQLLITCSWPYCARVMWLADLNAVRTRRVLTSVFNCFSSVLTFFF